MYFFIKFGRDVNPGERMGLVNTIATKPLHVSLSNLAGMLTMRRGWALLILEVRGQRSRSQWTRMEISCEPNIDLAVVCFLIKLGRHVNHGKPYCSTVKVTKGIILTNVGCAGMLRFAFLYLFLVPFCSQIFMPPAWKVRQGHLVIGSSVHPSVRLSVRNSVPLTNKV